MFRVRRSILFWGHPPGPRHIRDTRHEWTGARRRGGALGAVRLAIPVNTPLPSKSAHGTSGGHGDLGLRGRSACSSCNALLVWCCTLVGLVNTSPADTSANHRNESVRRTQWVLMGIAHWVPGRTQRPDCAHAVHGSFPPGKCEKPRHSSNRGQRHCRA